MKRKIQNSVLDILHDALILACSLSGFMILDFAVWFIYAVLTGNRGEAIINLIMFALKVCILLWILLIPYNIVCNFRNYQNYFRKFVYQFLKYWFTYDNEKVG